MRRTLLVLARCGAVAALVIGGVAVVAPGPASAATAVTISGAAGCSGTSFCFVPATATVSGGDTVTWTNQTGVAHTVTRCTAAACNNTDGGTGTGPAFDLSVASANGSTASQSFNGAGTYNYYCKIHGFAVMHGTITVQAAAATTTTAGSTTTTALATSTTTGPTTTTTATAPSTAAGTASAAPAATSTPAQPVQGQVNFTG